MVSLKYLKKKNNKRQDCGERKKLYIKNFNCYYILSNVIFKVNKSHNLKLTGWLFCFVVLFVLFSGAGRYC